MNILCPSLPAHHAMTQITPLKLRTMSIPTMGRVFKAAEVNQDLLIELEGATIDKGPFMSNHYILDVCNKLLPAMTKDLPSDGASLLHP